MDPFINVEIFDQTYRLRCDEANAEYIQRAAAYLDEKMREAASGGARKPLDIAILAAMNLAEEVLETRHQKNNLLDEADQRIDNFARLLDESQGLLDDKDDPPTDPSADPPAPRF